MAESEASGTVVVIDDDYVMRLTCRQILDKDGFQVETLEDGAQGLEAVARLKPDLVVVDLKMPGISGMEVISRLRELDPQVVIAVITGYASVASAVDAIKAGAYDFLPKPFTPDELRLVVARGLEHRRLMKASQQREIEREMMKRRFVTFVSHQLKTPLVAIHQYLNVLNHLDGTDGGRDKRKAWSDRCLKRADEMLQLIDDWLTLSQVEGGRLLKRRERLDLKGIITGILDSYAGSAQTNDVSLCGELPLSEYPVPGDRNCVTVLFDNLIDNAIKYNRPGGTVRVVAEVSRGEIVIDVVDTGVGISPQHHGSLFDDFFRVKGDATKDIPGSGLGLTICQRIVAEMGGRIEVESEPGVGSTFRVRLPMWRDQGQDEDNSPRSDP